MGQVTAIIPAFGHEVLTQGAVSRLRRQTRPPEEIIVVDDGTAEPLAPMAGARVLRHESKLGFAAAVNTGMLGSARETRESPAAGARRSSSLSNRSEEYNRDRGARLMMLSYPS